MISSVAVLLPEWVAMFEFGVACEVFGLDRSDVGVPLIDFRVCSKNPGEPVPSSSPGVTVVAEHGLDKLVGADVVVIPAGPVSTRPDPALVEAVRQAHDSGSTIVTICSGAFLAAAAGLLDDRSCTTHWKYAAKLANDYPRAKVDPDVLFVDEGSIITSAGTA
ncbi:MAG: DJ-1/PfpI family protein, partial [Nocardiaceae bacterium]|nr:DJ-1/PfpI family protein [Nocardiaceae bacterium]